MINKSYSWVELDPFIRSNYWESPGCYSLMASWGKTSRLVLTESCAYIDKWVALSRQKCKCSQLLVLSTVFVRFCLHFTRYTVCSFLFGRWRGNKYRVKWLYSHYAAGGVIAIRDEDRGDVLSKMNRLSCLKNG